jgi:hypothetical protein
LQFHNVCLTRGELYCKCSASSWIFLHFSNYSNYLRLGGSML